eukprot:TRINITY_DN1190_c0_g1_i3.p1 TRINITY_DN1190_c0_g1~~TRINITY_DN1190_c0_g1_i3.p1  ORF type:complete len:1358 (-),score=455.16 TRINITY_DN1190_c0_g1_i3:220-4293(-)
MSSSMDTSSPMLLEPSVTMREEPGEVYLNNEPRYNNGELPAQISITKIHNSSSPQIFKPRSDLAGIVPKGLRPVQIRPPPLLRASAGFLPPPPRLQFAGIPSNIRPVHGHSYGSSSNNPILGMMNVAKKVGNGHRFSPRGGPRVPSPRTSSQAMIRSSPVFHPGVPGIKNVSPMGHPSRPPPPMMRPGFRPVNVRLRGRPPLMKNRVPPPEQTKRENGPSSNKQEQPLPPIEEDLPTPKQNHQTEEKKKEEDVPKQNHQTEEKKKEEDVPKQNHQTEEKKKEEEDVPKHDDPPSKDPPHSPLIKSRLRKSPDTLLPPGNEDKASSSVVDQEEDKGATKFRFVRRADGKGFVKKSVKSSGAPIHQPFRKSYTSAVLKGIRKKKKKPFKGINYRFDGSIKKKKKNYFNSLHSLYKDDDDSSSIRSDRDLTNEHDVLTYLGIQRKDSTDSKSSVAEETKINKIISGPKARKSFGTGHSQKRSLNDEAPLHSNGVSKKTRTYSPKVGQYFPLPPAARPSQGGGGELLPPSGCSSGSVSLSASDEEDQKDEEDEMMMSKVVASYICECEKSIEDLLLRRNSSTLCRAIESVGGSRVGCKNPVQSYNQLRPDGKLPRKVFCEIHTERLRAHQACGFCGEFCSHGMFYLCRPNKNYVPHVFHQSCYNKAKVKICCHCGSKETPAVVQMTLKMDRAPLQLLRSVSKMSFPTMKKEKDSENEDSEEVIQYKMPNGKVISSHGLPLGLNNSVLQKVLNELEDKAPPKHLTRNMYFPTKSGDAVKILQLLSQGYSPNQKFSEFKNGSPLHLSASEGHVLNCHIFTQSGTELDSFDDSGNTPIHLASIKGRMEVLRYLLQAGADMGLRGEDGMTCLHLAAQNGHLDCVKIILAHHNIPRNFLNLQDDGGWTPLVWACENKHEKVIKYLLLRGSNPLIVDAEGNIALHWASLSGSKTICEVLMDYGCDVDARNTNGDAPIHIALRQDHYESAVLLLMRGAKTNLTNRVGQLPVDCMTKDAKCATIMKLSTKLDAMMTNNKVHVHERIVTNDVSKGKENCPIQCINAVDEEGPPKDYVYVRNNVVTSAIPVDRNHASLQHCKCEDVCSSEESCNCSKLSVKSWYDLEGKLKSSFDYKDPPMIFECNDLCNCNVSTCHNRVIQHGVTSRMIVFRTENMGWGVRALKDIAKGTFVCEYVGEIISDSEADTREDSYLFDLDYREGETYCIDANRFGNIARFINHSCNPSLTPVKVFSDHQDLRFPHIALFANRDIPKGTELGFDYGEKFWVIKHRAFTCHCGSEDCHYSSSSIQSFLKDYYERFPGELQFHEGNRTPGTRGSRASSEVNGHTPRRSLKGGANSPHPPSKQQQQP